MGQYIALETDIHNADLEPTLKAMFGGSFFRVAATAAIGLHRHALHWWLSGQFLETVLDRSIRGRRRHCAVYKDSSEDPATEAYLNSIEQAILRWRHDMRRLSPFERVVEEAGATFFVGRTMSGTAIDRLLSWCREHEQVQIALPGGLDIVTTVPDGGERGLALRTWSADDGPGDPFLEVELVSTALHPDLYSLRVRSSSRIWLFNPKSSAVEREGAEENTARLAAFWATVTTYASGPSRLTCEGRAFAEEETRLRSAFGAEG